MLLSLSFQTRSWSSVENCWWPRSTRKEWSAPGTRLTRTCLLRPGLLADTEKVVLVVSQERDLLVQVNHATEYFGMVQQLRFSQVLLLKLQRQDAEAISEFCKSAELGSSCKESIKCLP